VNTSRCADVRERFIVDGYIEAGYTTHFRVASGATTVRK